MKLTIFIKTEFVPRNGFVVRLFIMLSLITPIFLQSQPIENTFINSLVNKTGGLTDRVDKDELVKSGRLGINYAGINDKWLISFDIPDEIKAGLRRGQYNYTLQTLHLDGGFSVVTIAVGELNYLHRLFFLNDKFVSPSRFLTRNWQTIESRFFKFRISEPKYFNEYCIKRLDEFTDSLCNMLAIDPERKKLLEREKIYYILCKDEDEVEQITGFKSKGMSVLAFDEIITAYQTHFHEIAHILINFKLKNLGLYTNPFFMEGFAVAVGGRGGMSPHVVKDLGYYLQRSGFLTYDSIMTYESFYATDANMTYAVSGLYNSFLLRELGESKYLELYKKMNGDLDFVKGINNEDISLPGIDKLGYFLNNYFNDSLFIKGDKQRENYFCFSNNLNNYFIPLNCSEDENILNSNYSSQVYIDKTGIEYKGEHYLIKKDSVSVNLYDCFNNEQIYSYDKNFSLIPMEINSVQYLCLKNVLFDCLPKDQ